MRITITGADAFIAAILHDYHLPTEPYTGARHGGRPDGRPTERGWSAYLGAIGPFRHDAELSVSIDGARGVRPAWTILAYSLVRDPAAGDRVATVKRGVDVQNHAAFAIGPHEWFEPAECRQRLITHLLGLTPPAEGQTAAAAVEAAIRAAIAAHHSEIAQKHRRLAAWATLPE